MFLLQVRTIEIESDEDDEKGKLQYDRDFLLKFQTSPLCRSKPANLPNFDIVLDFPHQPTKPLVLDERYYLHFYSIFELHVLFVLFILSLNV